MALGQLQFSMVPTMSLLPNGGATDSSFLLSILSSGSELEGFGGSSLACGKGAGRQNLPTPTLVISDFLFTLRCNFPTLMLIFIFDCIS